MMRLSSLAVCVATLTLALIGAAGCVDPASEHRVRANALLRGGDAVAALQECEAGLAQQAKSIPLHILRGKALFELDRLDEARRAYEAAIALGRGDERRSLSEAYLGLAVTASRQNDWQAARNHFGTLVSINAQDASSHLNVAKACLELRDLACAVDHAEIAARHRGNEEPVLFALGTIYLEAGKLKEAALTFQHIGEVIPSAASCPYGLALVAARQNDRKTALAQLDEAVRRKLPNPDRIMKDPGFASMKEDPAFQQIAARANRP